jgi:putative PIN family toxin of toxin-antitoxin system
MVIVLDSNILLTVIGKQSKYRPIWTAFLDEKYNLVVSNEILLEYEEILQRRASSQIADIVLELFVEALNVINQNVYYSWNLIKNDPDDNKFFDVAVAANADYLVTNDAHFNVAKLIDFPIVKIISADEFLTIIQEG